MADCELLAGCIFFNDMMTDQPATSGLMKKRLCQGDNTECARHVVFRELGRENVPKDLFPNQVARAHYILRGA